MSTSNKRTTRSKSITASISSSPTQESMASMPKANKRHTKFNDNIYISINDEDKDYMKSFIIKGPEGYGLCILCPPIRGKSNSATEEKCKIATENIYEHIFTNKHETNTLKGDKDKLDKLKEAITEAKQKKQQRKHDFDEENAKCYLEFVSFALKENFLLHKYQQLVSIFDQ